MLLSDKARRVSWVRPFLCVTEVVLASLLIISQLAGLWFAKAMTADGGATVVYRHEWGNEDVPGASLVVVKHGDTTSSSSSSGTPGHSYTLALTQYACSWAAMQDLPSAMDVVARSVHDSDAAATIPCCTDERLRSPLAPHLASGQRRCLICDRHSPLCLVVAAERHLSLGLSVCFCLRLDLRTHGTKSGK